MRLPPILVRHAPPPLSPQQPQRTTLELPRASTSSRAVDFAGQATATPPAYDVVVHCEPDEFAGNVELDGGRRRRPSGGAASMQSEVEGRRAAMDGIDGYGSAERPLSSTVSDKDVPTVMVLFREDYAYARAYIRELDYRKAMRRGLRRVYYKWYLLAIVIITLTALMSAKHTTIVQFLKPVTQKIRQTPAGFLVPVAFLIIVSFPPLFGHELIGILCGLVWGLGVGFAILAAGTFLGEVATWIAFKWFCTARAAKLYASLTQLIREKSFVFVLILRFSAVPGHIVTAVSASAGANVWSYMAAAFLTLPKQLAIAYLGTAFGEHSFKNTIISWSTTIATFIGTVIAAAYIYYQMRIVIRRGSVVLPPAAVAGDGAGPSWADVEAAERRVSMVEVRGEKGRRSIDIFLAPAHARGGPAAPLHLRRPWNPALSPALSSEHVHYPIRTPGRTRSLPGPISDDEMREWLAQIDTALLADGHDGDGGTPHIRVSTADDGRRGVVPDALPVPSPSVVARGPRADDYLSPIPSTSALLTSPSETALLPLPTAGAAGRGEVTTYPPTQSPPRARTPAYGRGPGPSVSSRSGAVPRGHSRSRVDDLRDRDGGRGTVSLDIDRRPVLSGRELADEADRYAIAHGARRPDYLRMRGDSRAALLGRPDDDDLESRQGSP